MAEGMDEMQLLKVQSNTSGDEVMVYNEDRSVRTLIYGERAHAVMAALEMTNFDRAFVNGFVDSEGVLHVDAATQLPLKSWPKW